MTAVQTPAGVTTATAVDLSRLATQTYLSVDEAITYLRVHLTARDPRRAFYEWARRMHVPKCRVGRRLAFLRRDLDEAVRPAHVEPLSRLTRVR